MDRDTSAHVRAVARPVPLGEQLAKAANAKATRLVAVIAGMILGGLLWQSFLVDHDLRDQREALAKKSPSQRAAIRDQAVVFAALPEEERQRVRDVASHLAGKSDGEHARAKAGIDVFQEWLSGLPISERDSLRKQKSTNQRVAAVEALLAKQEQDVPSDDDSRNEFRRLRAIPHSQFNTLAEILEGAAGMDPQPDRQPLVRIVEIISDVRAEERDRTDMLRFVEPLTDQVLDLIQVDRAELEREFRNRLPGGRTFGDRPNGQPMPVGKQAVNGYVFATIIFSIDQEYQQLKRDLRITEEDLQTAINKRPALEDRLLNLSSPQFRAALTKYAVFDKIRDEESDVTDEDLERLLGFSRMLNGGGRGFLPRFGEDRFRGGPPSFRRDGDPDRRGGGGGGGIGRPPGESGRGGRPRGPEPFRDRSN